jgi:uncharacterized membrane protein YraQ (UPF0718 family)
MTSNTHSTPKEQTSPTSDVRNLPIPPIRPMMFVALGVIILLALVYGSLNSGQDFFAVVRIFATRFLGIFIEAVPFLLLGSFTAGMIEAFVRPEDIIRFLPKNRFFATVGGAFMGIIFPVCECGVVPVARRLYTKGLPMSVGIAFLLAAPFMNPIVFASTFIAFGDGRIEIFIGRFVITGLVAISIGLLFAFFARPEDILLPSSMMDEEACAVPAPRPNLRQGMAQAITVANHDFFEMGRYLVMGTLMASAMQTFIAQDTLFAIGDGPVISVLVMQAFAFILSVCSTVDSFLALAFVNTFTTGSILAFLSFGPMVDIKSTMMFLGVFQKRVVFYLILLPFVMNFFAGVLVNTLMGYF